MKNFLKKYKLNEFNQLKAMSNFSLIIQEFKQFGYIKESIADGNTFFRSISINHFEQVIKNPQALNLLKDIYDQVYNKKIVL